VHSLFSSARSCLKGLQASSAGSVLVLFGMFVSLGVGLLLILDKAWEGLSHIKLSVDSFVGEFVEFVLVSFHMRNEVNEVLGFSEFL